MNFRKAIGDTLRAVGLKPKIPQLQLLEEIIPANSTAAIKIGDVYIDLDLSNTHERLYLLSDVFHLDHPQHDIDVKLIERLCRPGDVVLDAGANIGVTAALFLKAGAAKVYAIEPEPNLVNRLKQIKTASIFPFGVALGDKTGAAELIISTSHNQGNSINPLWVTTFKDVFSEPKTVSVQLDTLDNLFPQQRFDLWKVDVEGSESAMMRGAKMHLSTRKPRALIVELYDLQKQEFFGVLQGVFSNQYRALIRQSDKALCFERPHIDNAGLAAYFPTSPTYVFTDENLN